MRTLVIADNQDITKAGILYVCDKMPDSYQLKEAANRKELLELLSVSTDALVILDYTLFDFNSVEDLLILQTRFPAMSWVLISEQLSADFIRRIAYSEEPFCIVLKESPLNEIEMAIQFALRYEPYVCNRVRQLLIKNRFKVKEQEPEVLTTTEKEILKQIALGKTTKEIAAERFSSVHTVMTHRKNIFRKLEVNNIHEATKYALRAGIIDSAEYYI